MLNIVEKFISIGGEAPLIGKPVYIVRFSGCNLSCEYCDTAYHYEKNVTITAKDLISDIKGQLQKYSFLKVLFTGGEPLLDERQDEITSIIESLHEYSCYVETNGSIRINNFLLPNSYYIVDWKAPSSKHGEDFCIENLKQLRPGNDCIKFVVDTSDLEWLQDKIDMVKVINPHVDMYVSPQWEQLDYRELVAFILENRLPVSASFQMHKHIWDADTRGV